MLPRPLRSLTITVFALAFACNDAGPAASTADETTTQATTGALDPTGGASETGGAVSRELCERHIACTAAINPMGLSQAEMAFGEDSECWEQDQSSIDTCLSTCESALLAAHAVHPDEPACYQCEDDSDCDQAEGEHCLKGACGQGQCGDGLVQAGELCDGQEGCSSDCLKGATCSPLTNVGCASAEYCVYGGSPGAPLSTKCNADTPYACGEADCPRGTYALEIDDTQCECAPFCDVGAPEPCPDGLTCVAVHAPPDVELGETALHYLGKCQ